MNALVTIGGEELTIWILRSIYAASLVAVCLCLFARAVRALTKRVEQGDLQCLLFWGLAFNRLWFLVRGARFMGSLDQHYEGATLAACYIFAIALETMVCVAWWWDRKRVKR